ncbi:MAG: glycosyltransferase WbsX family protein [Ignavibacteriaceae bacterium]
MINRNMFFGILVIQIFTAFIVSKNSLAQNDHMGKSPRYITSTSNSKYDVAAFYWPNYHYDPKLGFIFHDKKGEWETMWSAKPKIPGERQPRVPLWGYQNEADPKVMNEKINAAVSHDVNIFIFDWYWYGNRPLLEDCLDNGFLRDNHHRMKFYIMWANHDATTYWDPKESNKTLVYWKGGVNRATFNTIVNRVINKYFRRSSYYKIDGKPVFAIYELGNFIKGIGGTKAAKEALDYFRRKTIEAGFRGLYMQAILWSALPKNLPGVPMDRVGTQNEVLKYLGFNSITNYTWAHLQTPEGDYDKWAAASTDLWETYSKEFSIPYFPNVSVDWDNNPRYPSSIITPYITNSTPEKFKKYLFKAKQYIDNHPLQPKLITINAWNEWAEGSYLEPDKKYGYKYLDAVKKVFGAHK